MIEQSIHTYPNGERLKIDYETAWAPHGWYIRHLCQQQVTERHAWLVVVFERDKPAEGPTP